MKTQIRISVYHPYLGCTMQIMTKVFIKSFFMPFIAYRDKISLSLYPRSGIKQDRIYTEVIICIISQSRHQKLLIIRWLTGGRYQCKILTSCEVNIKYFRNNTNIKYLETKTLYSRKINTHPELSPTLVKAAKYPSRVVIYPCASSKIPIQSCHLTQLQREKNVPSCHLPQL